MRAKEGLLDPAAAEVLKEALYRLDVCLRQRSAEAKIREALNELHAAADVALPAGALAAHREAIEFLVVAFIIFLAARVFFVQPVTVPTGSMYPTLSGVQVINLKGDAREPVPGWPGRLWDRVMHGTRYVHVVAEEEGEFDPEGIEEVERLWWGMRRQRFSIGEVVYTIWNPPRMLPARGSLPPQYLLFAHAGLEPGTRYRRGETVLALKVVSGDHLLVDRLTYNFRRPRRGEIVVFSASGVADLPAGYLYLKRLVGLGGERLRIGNDQHLMVDGHRLDRTTPGFESVYGRRFELRPTGVTGHLNREVLRVLRLPGSTAKLFPDGHTDFEVPAKHYVVMGDNSASSADSRSWGSLPRENVFGRAWMVWWPFNWAWGVRFRD